MLYSDDFMESRMAVLFERDRRAVYELARLGPQEEPRCGVCGALITLANSKIDGYPLPGWAAAMDVICYHDELIYDVDEEDYLKATGLAGIVTYQRCLKIYAEARRLVSV